MNIKKLPQWMIPAVIVLAVLFGTSLALRWQTLPWSPAYQTSPPYLPPPGDVQATATYFSPTSPTPTFEPNRIWIDPVLPAALKNQLDLKNDLLFTDMAGDAETTLTISSDNPLAYWVLSAAAPFPTLQDAISGDSLRAAWQGGSNPLGGNQPLLMTQHTRDLISAMWGEPAGGAVEILAAEALRDQAWSRQPALAILPFEKLDPSWKVLRVNGISPLAKDFSPADYPLAVPISAAGARPDLIPEFEGNRNPDQLTSVALTGVTALVRATAWTMEKEGLNYPARDIITYLQEADILHISNEVPFMQSCPYPDPGQKGLVFCSDPRYIKLMETIGTDVVELTGDHFGDYGPEAMLYTLELYRQRDWPYYGGGANRGEAQQPVQLEHNGNKIAFLGCNAKGGGYATAAPGYPGAVACDFQTMTQQIRDLREQGYSPIATFQHFEYYTYQAQPDQIRDARTLTNAGAVIVSGSQAHQPQAFEIQDGAFIHHGLGNLFFDQVYEIPPNTATAFIDRHIFYNGKHISTELLTIKFEDFARARPMTPSERETLLRTVFAASGW
jgi:poly-gamma-glutamate synthesis protein (capsule biosynthesis protein)